MNHVPNQLFLEVSHPFWSFFANAMFIGGWELETGK